MLYRSLRVVVTDWGNQRGRIFFPTGFAPSEDKKVGNLYVCCRPDFPQQRLHAQQESKRSDAHKY